MCNTKAAIAHRSIRASAKSIFMYDVPSPLCAGHIMDAISAYLRQDQKQRLYGAVLINLCFTRTACIHVGYILKAKGCLV